MIRSLIAILCVSFASHGIALNNPPVPPQTQNTETLYSVSATASTQQAPGTYNTTNVRKLLLLQDQGNYDRAWTDAGLALFESIVIFGLTASASLAEQLRKNFYAKHTAAVQHHLVLTGGLFGAMWAFHYAQRVLPVFIYAFQQFYNDPATIVQPSTHAPQT